MSRLKYSDAIVELSELATDLLADIRQQAAYYRASVYKAETLQSINRRMDCLAIIVRILKSAELGECIADFRATAPDAQKLKETAGDGQFADCQLTIRVARFLVDAESALDKIKKSARKNACQIETKQLVKGILRNRKELAAMSRHGSRSWAFLQTI